MCQSRPLSATPFRPKFPPNSPFLARPDLATKRGERHQVQQPALPRGRVSGGALLLQLKPCLLPAALTDNRRPGRGPSAEAMTASPRDAPGCSGALTHHRSREVCDSPLCPFCSLPGGCCQRLHHRLLPGCTCLSSPGILSLLFPQSLT